MDAKDEGARMRIVLTFKERGERKPQVRTMTPEEYFDPLEPGETYSEEGVPKFNNLEEYIGLEPGFLEWIQVRVTDQLASRLVRTDYSPSGLNFLTYVREECEDEPTYEELIINNQLDHNVCNIMRISRSDLEAWACHVNTIIRTHADGTEEETLLECWGSKQV
jgi:hypothetical protein